MPATTTAPRRPTRMGHPTAVTAPISTVSAAPSSAQSQAPLPLAAQAKLDRRGLRDGDTPFAGLPVAKENLERALRRPELKTAR